MEEEKNITSEANNSSDQISELLAELKAQREQNQELLARLDADKAVDNSGVDATAFDKAKQKITTADEAEQSKIDMQKKYGFLQNVISAGKGFDNKICNQILNDFAMSDNRDYEEQGKTLQIELCKGFFDLEGNRIIALPSDKKIIEEFMNASDSERYKKSDKYFEVLERTSEQARRQAVGSARAEGSAGNSIANRHRGIRENSNYWVNKQKRENSIYV